MELRKMKRKSLGLVGKGGHWLGSYCTVYPAKLTALTSDGLVKTKKGKQMQSFGLKNKIVSSSQCCGSRIFYPGSQIRIRTIFHPGSWIRAFFIPDPT
jgi:hypothetical protein